MDEKVFDFSEYLECTPYVNFNNESVKTKADELKSSADSEVGLIRNTYLFVRDDIKHSWDAQDKRVTVTAADVLKEGVGICWSKANLLAALLRANGIPSGFSYQKLTLFDTPEHGYCIHALTTVYISSMDKWIRLDARGNKENVAAEFSVDEEILAFEVRTQLGEVDYHDNNAGPSEKLMEVLKTSNDALDMYVHRLPEDLYED